MQKGNIIGEAFDKYVNDQIKQRQKIYGSGRNSSRDPKYIQYLNSRTTWIKMASSVIITPDFESQLNVENAIRFDETKEGIKKLQNLGFSESEIGNFVGVGLAKKAVLFKGLSDSDVNRNEDVTITNSPISQYIPREGIINYNPKDSIWNSNFSYGLGGLEFGIQPSPGIISFKVESLNRGSIRKGNIQIKAFNKTQFEIINLLYLRLGFSMLVEWGDSHYINNKDEYSQTNLTYIEKHWFNNPDSDQFELLKKLETIRKDNAGNVDSFFCKVSNYSWNFNTDGSYDISIDLVSLGDVIESLKVNNLTQPLTPQDEDQKSDKEWNINDIINHLKSLENNPEIFSNPDIQNDKRSKILLDLNRYVQPKANTTISGYDTSSTAIPDFRVEDKYRYFYKLGDFLKFLSIYIIPTIKTNGGKNDNYLPLIAIDTEEEENIMSIYPNQISFDPHTCIIKNTNLKSKIPFDKTNQIKPVEPYFYSNMDSFNMGNDYGKIMNIYINFNFIKNILKSQDKKGNINLYKLLTDLCEGINRALGGVNNLEPVVIEERNTIVLIDQNIVANNDEIRKKLNLTDSNNSDSESVLFNLYGYQENESNFVKKYSLNTKITPELSTQISIGATAKGTIVGEDSTFFSQLNSGLVDKFKLETVNKIIPDFLGAPQKTPEKNNKFWENYWGFWKSIGNYIKNPFYKLEEQYLEKINSEYLYYINSIFTSSSGKPYLSYLKFPLEVKQQGLSLWKVYLDKLSIEQRQKNTSLNTIGFIPLTLSLTLDGISGIKIYQKLKINTKFLPSGFPDNIDFIITKVNHNISNNKWTTELEALSIPKTKNIIENNVVEDNKVKILNPNEDLIFFPPITRNAIFLFTTNKNINGKTLPKYGNEYYISTSPLPLLIRDDDGGSGYINAPRDNKSRYHKGIDIKVGRGQEIYSPIDGKTTIITEDNGSKGVKIVGSGDFKDYRAIILYTKDNIRSGTIVKKGDIIGKAVGKLYPTYYKDDKIGDHIHFSMYIERNNQKYYLDPSDPNSVKYSSTGLGKATNEIKFISEKQVQLIEREFLNRQGKSFTQ